VIVTDLPIEPVLPALLDALATGRNAVLQAPPGAGKTTRVPLALLDQPWLGAAKIVMLEPRRLAARAAARRMAAMLGEQVGETVGYRIRMDSKIGPKTRIEVVTEGILTRMMQDDPGLEGVGIVLFDEFHERSLNADLGLALCLETQASLRDDLRLVAMSATLDGEPVARLMGGAPLVTSEGRSFPVEIRWLDKPLAGRFEDGVASLVFRALDEVPEGDILVFLPGQGEIRRVQARLADGDSSILVTPLYGDLSQEAQDAALRPQPGRRKVVLSTSIAETSLTIEGVTVVVDGGQMRVPRFDPNGGMTRLVTVAVSKASAEQRRGRAGRLGPGACYRLWTEATHRGLAPFSAPEIAEADLAPLALELARWGVADPTAMAWLEVPPAAAYAQAVALLGRLGGLDGEGKITRHGRRMAELPLHPRLAHSVLKGAELGLGGLACDIAALLSERDILRGERDADLRLRLEMLRDPRGGSVDRGGVARVREVAKQLRRLVKVPGPPPPQPLPARGRGSRPAAIEAAAKGTDVPARRGTYEESSNIDDAGLLLAFAYPDRIALRRGGQGLQYRLSNGRGAFFAQPEALATEDLLAVADLDGDKRESRIFLAAPLTIAELEEHFEITQGETVAWDSREQLVAARRQRRLGELVLKDEALSSPSREAVAAAMIAGIREIGLNCLPWTPAAEALRARVNFLRRVEGEAWPDLSDAALLTGLEDWLAPWLDGISRRAHLARLDIHGALDALLPWEMKRQLDAEAPTHVAVPSGSRIPIDYASGEIPVLAVRLQEMFGLADTPAIGGGRVKLVLHLLSPARRPVQVTQDLASFWANAYKQVKADLKGQYPKHYWPDDPMQAEPTARAKPRGT
jgi:ATP-dependent helicase HrpB